MSSQKVCEVCWGNPLQGLGAHIVRYRNSPVMHQSVPDEYPGIAQAYFYIFCVILSYFSGKSIDLRLSERQNIWNLVWNDSGVILDVLEIDPEPFLIVQVDVWNSF